MAGAAFFTFLLWARPTTRTTWTDADSDLRLVVRVSDVTPEVGQVVAFTFETTSNRTLVDRITVVWGDGDDGFGQINDYTSDACEQPGPFAFKKSYDHTYKTASAGTPQTFRVTMDGSRCGTRDPQHVEVAGVLDVRAGV
jgi:hypothetical protein